MSRGFAQLFLSPENGPFEVTTKLGSAHAEKVKIKGTAAGYKSIMITIMVKSDPKPVGCSFFL